MDAVVQSEKEVIRRPSDRQMADEGPLYAKPRHVKDIANCFFYHTVELPAFGTQEGGWDLRGRYMDYIGHVDLRGKRVLDVGTATGFLSFEAERHGASEVVSFDLDTAERQTLLPFAGSSYVDDYENWCRLQTQSFDGWKNAYWLTHRLLNSRAKVVYGDVYRPPQAMGRFDVIILGAILEHLIDPLSALTAVSAFTDSFLVINTDYFDSPQPVALFNGRADRPDNSFTFWTYSISVYDHFMQILGFVPIAAHKGKFAGTPASTPGAPRPMLERVALVYKRIGSK